MPFLPAPAAGRPGRLGGLAPASPATSSSRGGPRTASSTSASRAIPDDLTAGRRPRRRRAHRHAAHRLVLLQRRAGQPPARGGGLELPRTTPATSPPTARTASGHGWTGDWQLFVPDRRLPLRRRRLLDQVAARRRRRPVARRHRRQHQPEPRAARAGTSPIAFLNGSAGWGDAAVIVPWELYRAYGDVRVLDELWPTMVALAGPRRADGPRAAAPRPGRRAGPSPRRTSSTSGTPASTGASGWCPARTPADFGAFVAADKGDVATAYYAHSAGLMARIAAVLGRDDDAARYAELSEHVRAAWQAEYLDADGRLTPGHAGQPRPRAGVRPGARRSCGRRSPTGWSS